MLSEKDSIPAKDIVGKNVTVQLRLIDGSTFRYFNGYVSRFSAGSKESNYRWYQAEVVPWLWFLTLSTDCRVFQNKSVPDIVKQVFDDFGFSGQYDAGEIQETHETLEYCVQYRETAFNFVSRLMEQEGIFITSSTSTASTPWSWPTRTRPSRTARRRRSTTLLPARPAPSPRPA